MAELDALDRLGPGDHACLVFDDESVWARGVASFIRSGLRRHLRIMYCGRDADRLPAILGGLGLNVGAALESGQLALAGVDTAYLRKGVFDPEASLLAWAAQVAAARAAGYRGMVGIGDMSWACRYAGIEQLAWYEAQVNRICVDGFTMGVCLYDRRLFSEPDLRRVTRTHPAPLLRAVRTSEPRGLRVAGEADLSNRQALRAVVEHLIEDTAAGPEPVTLDLSDLRFADSAAARILLTPARGTPLRVTGVSGPLRRLLDFHWSGPPEDLRIE
ncbi:hypothetical protein ACWT_6797 [Actinoplanes sp. SE50]|uniref:MEDS domain-containing protein n=1 Tax=unclassified Actinoplanes TaxID=2626549 RepID=UPI00023ED143|nr:MULTISPECIES: MEDS domain-containing protein [unclassified Actinoplanes]AEV87810.1 hypothetical protein ACPL_6928 [Actinoplanes sp. SE50/110]ATO86212.1 hypothetical protein ACWT_6797 [Actinoplanes sp. SE50]SLM03626.1 hypothetical protein ACSP50_6919 [Actinoplanes sp. SE50/110]